MPTHIEPTLQTIDPAIDRAKETDYATALKASMTKLFGAKPDGAIVADPGPRLNAAGQVIEQPIAPAGPTGVAATGTPAAPTGTTFTGPTGTPGTGPTGTPGTGATGTPGTGATGAPAEPLSTAEKLAKELAEFKDPAKVAEKAAADKKAAEEAANKAKGRLTEEQRDAAAKTMTPNAGTAFKDVRDENAEVTARNEKLVADMAALQKKLDDAAMNPVNPEKIAEMQKKLDRYELELGAVRVEATEEFQDKVTRPIASITTELTAIASKYKIPEVDLRAALSEPDITKRNDRLAELTGETITNRFDISHFDRLVDELDGVEKTRSALLAGAADKAKTLAADQTSQAEQNKAQIQAQWKNAVTQVRAKLTAENPLFRETADESWNKDMKEVLDTAEATDITKLSNDDIATALYHNRVYPMLVKLITELYGQTAKLNGTITKLRGTSVPAGEGDLPGNVVVQEKPKTFAEAAKGRLAGILPP